MNGQREVRAFLFADLRGYSAFTERYGDEAARALIGRYRELVRAEIARYDGAEIRTEGDSFYVVFNSIADAVLAGLAIASRATAPETGEPIRVGIGIHAGEIVDDEREGIVSSAVNIAARICATADPGEILVSDTVRGLTRTTLPVRFTSRGRRRLKGISEPIALYSVESKDAPERTTRRRKEAAAAALVTVALLAVALVALRPGLPVPPGADGSVAGSASGSPVQTHDLSRFNDPGEYPNAVEQALLDQLPSQITTSCERADPVGVPRAYFPPELSPGGLPTSEPLIVRAGVSCLTSSIRVTYWQKVETNYPSADEFLFNRAAKLSIVEGDCATRHRAWEAWTAGAHGGHVMCLIRGDESVLEWSYSDANVYAIATRHGDDMEALFDWWRDVGRLLSR